MLRMVTLWPLAFEPTEIRFVPLLLGAVSFRLWPIFLLLVGFVFGLLRLLLPVRFSRLF